MQQLDKVPDWSPAVVPFERDGESYEIDVAARVQRNLSSGECRPVRPPGSETMDLCALQGSWHTSMGLLTELWRYFCCIF